MENIEELENIALSSKMSILDAIGEIKHQLEDALAENEGLKARLRQA